MNAQLRVQLLLSLSVQLRLRRKYITNLHITIRKIVFVSNCPIYAFAAKLAPPHTRSLRAQMSEVMLQSHFWTAKDCMECVTTHNYHISTGFKLRQNSEFLSRTTQSLNISKAEVSAFLFSFSSCLQCNLKGLVWEPICILRKKKICWFLFLK